MSFNANNYLAHHGIKGQKWGVRRFQNSDGSMTSAGRARYGTAEKTRRLPDVNLKKDSERSHNASVKQAKKIMAKQKADSDSIGDKAFSNTVKGGKDKPNISPAENIAKKSGQAIGEIKTGLDAAYSIKNRNKPKDSYTGLSDEELRQRINRIRMEKEYESLTAKERSKGYETAMNVLTLAGSVVGTTAAVISIYSQVKDLRKKA